MPPQTPGKPKTKKPTRQPSAAGQNWTRYEDGSAGPTKHKAVKTMKKRPLRSQPAAGYLTERRSTGPVGAHVTKRRHQTVDEKGSPHVYNPEQKSYNKHKAKAVAMSIFDARTVGMHKKHKRSRLW